MKREASEQTQIVEQDGNHRHLRKILVANRGEIARRVMRTCRALGIASVAVYSDADRRSPHVRFADEAIRIGPPPSRESYLSIERIIEAARRTGADAVHPGYGFLSEKAEFAEACTAAGLVFIGPSAESMRLMGLKSPARRLVSSTGVQIVPGYDGEDQSSERLHTEALRIGLPVLIKASAGGGGKGMRVVREATELESALSAARREAESAFGDGALLLEKFIAHARHVEVQILGDQHGHIVHLFERDCSLQRRHQKVIEECPSPVVDADLRARLGAAAIEVGRAIAYTNAGTVEFILDPAGEFYFIEVNTRLQVEHPVTEMVTGLDLVRLQIEIAEGRMLPFSQDDLRMSGHAIEARIYAEDPVSDFLPATGRLRRWEMPGGIEGVRIDSGVETGIEIGIHYDPLLAKFVARGADREEARRRLVYALRAASIQGVTTNRDFLIELLEHDTVRCGRAETGTIGAHLDELRSPMNEESRQLSAVVTAIWLQRSWQQEDRLLSALPPGYRNNPYRNASVEVRIAGETVSVSWRWIEAERFEVLIRDRAFDVRLCAWRESGIELEIDGAFREYHLSRDGDLFDWHSMAGDWTVARLPRFPVRDDGGGDETANAPMPGQVLKILVTPGQRVERGDPLMILEAMKMEQTIRSAVSGIVESILVETGAVVSPGDLLVHIAPGEEG